MNPHPVTAPRCVFLLSFNRPAFLGQTLDSLRRQTARDWRIFLFQDGPRKDCEAGDETDIGRCEALFREHFPEGTLVRHARNLGIGLNMLSAQEHAFRVLRCDAAYFFEDDLVLHERYLEQLFQLEPVLQPHRMTVPYFAAYGGIHTVPLPDLAFLSDDLRFMEHFWGYGLFRDPWEEEQALLQPYFDYLRGVEYTRRDHFRIRAIFRGLGWPHHATSQDGARTAALCAKRRCAVTTRQPLARYIGDAGTHWSRRDFRAWGFSDVAPDADAEPVAPEFPGHLLPELGGRFQRWIGEMQELPLAALRRALDRIDPTAPTQPDRHFEGEIARLLRRIRALEGSTSWRITRPLRKAGDLIGRLRGRTP